MAELRVDLYSDTHTRPTQAMRAAIAAAEVGDEQAFEDPTVNRLCEAAAGLLGKEAAVFMPSGTMCNQVAFRVHCRPGDEIILDALAHPLNSEAGGPAAVSGAATRPVEGERGIFTADQVRAALRPLRRHAPRSRVLSLENTVNFGGGAVWPLEAVAEVAAVARENGLAVHMDGARLLNAVVESGTPARAYAAHCDSIWIDLSKGLGCPIGAVLAGSAAFVDQAWRFKQQLGGAMRQAGIVAAAGLYALEHHVERLAEDHENARAFAAAIAEVPGVSLAYPQCETNIVFFDLDAAGPDAQEVARRLRERGVRIGAMGPRRMRAVTHLDVDRAGVEAAAAALRDVLAG
ncbi:MAG TPA: threonine aldolase family protein [Alphaproteobacteria bacterium]|nr:threonine aldolase family protein [Alphaproteobacteria bacterium]